MIKKTIKNILYLPLLALLALLHTGCQDDFESKFDYTASGEDVTLTIPVSFPKMDVKSRADLTDDQENAVTSLWICTFSASSGTKTSEWVRVGNLPTADTEVARNVTINTKSGNSYIVAVANVDNYGVQIKNGIRAQLSTLLNDVNTWEDFLGIVVETPSDWDDVRVPYDANPIPMVGAFYNIPVSGSHPVDLTNWQNSNFTPIAIPSNSEHKVSLGDGGATGAIHLRRVVSHIKFEIYAGRNTIELTPQSYRVVNAPVNTWLYERSVQTGVSMPDYLNTANYGDAATEETKNNFYKSPSQYSSIHFDNSTYTSQGVTYNGKSFNFWQGENKHYGTSQTYNEREKEAKGSDGGNTGIYTSLSGDVWTPNNMASYVVVNCDVKYVDRLNVDADGALSNVGTSVERTATVNYVVHLGYCEGTTVASKSRDFNCYRNVNYIYRMFVDGVDQIRIEAFAEDGSEPYPGAEGLVSDVLNPTYNLDCHNCAFNVQLTALELSPYDQMNNTGFGFIVNTYEGGEKFTIEESDILGMTDTEYEEWLASSGQGDALNAEYLTWIELIPTTGANVIKPYKPRTASNDTYYLSDISRGRKGGQAINLADGYYTVHVKEYAYEPETGIETPEEGKDPRWKGYINQLPRQFFMRVTRAISNDGESVYARSKYAAAQRSINTYYSDQNFTSNGTAVGVEHQNESFGISLRKSYDVPTASDVNGRYNAWQWISYNSASRLWTAFLSSKNGNFSTLNIPAVNNSQGVISARTEYVPMLAAYGGSFSANSGNVASSLDPQGSNTAANGNINIEAINACMNRNRDDNGNGVIDPQELKWYVPTTGKYLRMILGRRSLDEPIMDYQNIEKISNPNGTATRYLFYASNGQILWAMEGLSMSSWCQWGWNDPGAPWQVRCIRNLGTNLSDTKTLTDVSSSDGVQMAYVVGGDNIVNMNYYGATSIRTNKLTMNGTVAGSQTNSSVMPPHVITSEYNNPYMAFQYSRGRYSFSGSGGIFHYDVHYDRLADYMNGVTSNPCSVLNNTEAGFYETGWRIPNQKELTIMRNLGLFEYINGSSTGGLQTTDNYIASCTKGYFNSSGVGYNNSDATDPLADRYYLGARYGAATQLNTNMLIRNVFIRCVRDIERNVEP